MADLFGMLQAASGSGGGEPDPYFNQTTLLLHGDGTNGAQNNAFLDSSTNNFTITRNGNTTQGTFSPFSVAEGQWSNYFDTSAYLSHSADLIGSTTSTFTVEGWVYLTATPTSSFEISAFCGLSGQGNGANNYMSFGPTSDSKITLRWFDGTTKSAKSTNTLALNTWYYIACVVNSNTISLYINGVSEVVTGTSTLTNRNGSASESYVGGKAYTYATLAGYISNVKVSSVARTITPQTAPFSSDANTVLLTCQSNRFIDNSASPKTLTIGGSPSVQPFSPFAPTAEYDASVNGGSGYWDNSGDSLVVANSSSFAFGTGDFTVEFFYRGIDTGRNFSLPSGGSTGYWSLILFGGSLYWQNAYNVSNLLIFSAASITNQAWNHVAVVRDSGTLRFFFNGVSVASVSDTTNYNGTAGNRTINAGDNAAGSYLSSYRIVKGTAIYPGSTSFTPPTAPLTAVSGTELLLNFTNAGIFDNTGKNNLETVGNAQIDTATKVFGTGSMEFDGTGDYLSAPMTPNLVFGTGDMTIECWVYANTISGIDTIFDTRTSGTFAGESFLLQLSSGIPQVWAGSYADDVPVVAGSAAISTSTWTHIAFTRSSGTNNLFVNGTSVGSNSNAWNQVLVTTNRYFIGQTVGVDRPFDGYIDDLRITKGVARYTAAFTPPTAAFPDL